MALHDLIKSEEELAAIAELMLQELKGKGAAVSRFMNIAEDRSSFAQGKCASSLSTQSQINLEQIEKKIYTHLDGARLLTPETYRENVLARDLQKGRFSFDHKGIPLPNETSIHISAIPKMQDYFDAELAAFSATRPLVATSRSLKVVQTVIVNNQGGVAIQSLPFFSIEYHKGLPPFISGRKIQMLCQDDSELRRFPELIAYLPDPTPDRRIRSAKSFTEAFKQLDRISGLVYGSFEEAGIRRAELYDIVVLSGMPIHEIFGHHFEEPIQHLRSGETATFRFGQTLQNKGITFKDNPFQEVAGFKTNAFTHFDAYGRPREERTHIENGQVVGFLGSEYVDSEKLKRYIGMEQSKFLGNAGQYIDGAFPQARMSCTVLDGPRTGIDLEGKIVVVPKNGHTNNNDKNYKLETEECYLIRDGEPRRIMPLKITGGINQAFTRMGLLDDMVYDPGTCGKPDPLNDRSQARIPVSEFTPTQLWEGQQVYPLEFSEEQQEVLQKR